MFFSYYCKTRRVNGIKFCLENQQLKFLFNIGTKNFLSYKNAASNKLQLNTKYGHKFDEHEHSNLVYSWKFNYGPEFNHSYIKTLYFSKENNIECLVERNYYNGKKILRQRK